MRQQILTVDQNFTLDSFSLYTHIYIGTSVTLRYAIIVLLEYRSVDMQEHTFSDARNLKKAKDARTCLEQMLAT